MSKFTGFEISFRSMSLRTAFHLQVSSIFKNTTSTEGVGLTFDALLHTDDFTPVLTDEHGNTLEDPYAVRKGVGLRIAMKSLKVDAKLAVSFAAAAALTMDTSMTSFSYRVEGLGLSTDLIKDVFKVSIEGEFNESTYAALRDVLAVKLPAYLDGNDLDPSKAGQYNVPLQTAEQAAASRARSINYAIGQIGMRNSPADAMGHLPSGISSGPVLTAYAYFTGSTEPGSKTRPTEQQAARANAWLNGK